MHYNHNENSENSEMSPAATLSPPSTANMTKCQNCGAELHSDEAQRRITELEAQVRILSEKATNAGKLFFIPLSLSHSPTQTN